MSAAIIVQLITALGPVALELIPRIAGVWKKAELTPEEVIELLAPIKKSYDQYIAEARQRFNAG